MSEQGQNEYLVVILPPKDREVLQARLLDDRWWTIVVDRTMAGVDLPADVRPDERMVTLKVSLAALPSELTDDALIVTMNFAGVPARCVLPWRSIVIMHPRLSTGIKVDDPFFVRLEKPESGLVIHQMFLRNAPVQLWARCVVAARGTIDGAER